MQSTDPVGKRFNGNLKLKDDQRTIQFTNQEADVPVVIYLKGKGQPVQLVVSEVHNREVSGYLLMPSAPAGTHGGDQ